MKTSILICIRSLCLFSLLICLPAFVHAQERLQIADLFSKYGEQKDVTRVELNGSILKSYQDRKRLHGHFDLHRGSAQ